MRKLSDWLSRVLADVVLTWRFMGETIYWSTRRPFRFGLFIEALEFVGVQSVFIVALTGVFVGMVFALQLVYGFRQFGAENQAGSVVGLALSRELAPVFSALMISSRAGSAMSTELGSMRVTDQIDALSTMAVNPVQYLIVPRVFAGLVMGPVLTVLFNVVGILGAWVVCVHFLGLDSGIFINKVEWYVDTGDIMQGLIKSAVFGFVISMIACKQGYYASGGAAGVGQATNRAIVQSAVAILVLDYIITSIITELGFLE